jgi:hypothetical protein
VNQIVVRTTIQQGLPGPQVSECCSTWPASSRSSLPSASTCLPKAIVPAVTVNRKPCPLGLASNPASSGTSFTNVFSSLVFNLVGHFPALE